MLKEEWVQDYNTQPLYSICQKINSVSLEG